MIQLLAALTAAMLFTAYRVYGRWLARRLELDDGRPTPAHTHRDDRDFVPTGTGALVGQHFSAIAAAGPIVGPILAGLMFGWAPALAWIVIGAIFIGGTHDFVSLVASIRNEGKSIAEIVRRAMPPFTYPLFLLFVWCALLYIVVAFTDITAQSFIGEQRLENGEVVRGAGIATSSLLYILLPILMGLCSRFLGMSNSVLALIFLPATGLVIWGGQYIPLDLAALLGVSETTAHKLWDVVILVYCVLAALVPVWLLLQPRGFLGGCFLYFFLATGTGGVLVGGAELKAPAFSGWTAATGQGLFPFLFVTIACGAVSGFHSLIASGTTSKQLARESDAKLVGYGTMLLEAGVAFVSLSCVMILAPADPLRGQAPNMIFASGISSTLASIGVPQTLAVSLMLMAFTTFVYDTLDICTRLGRYVLEELTGWRGRSGAVFGTVLTAAIPAILVFHTSFDAAGNVVPAWRAFWPLFGASNQLLAALTLLVLTVWLHSIYAARWVLWVTGLPCVFMYGVSCVALWQMAGVRDAAGGLAMSSIVALVLLGLAALMAASGIASLRRTMVPAVH